MKLQFSTKKRKIVNSKNFWFFTNFWSFFKLFLFYLKRELNCQYFAKKITEIGGTVLEISYFEIEKPSKFFDFWIFKAFFRPLRTQIAPNFRFCALFAISDNKQRVWYITRGIYPAFLENRIFFLHFAVLPVFMK